jgi:hypothetical protein
MHLEKKLHMLFSFRSPIKPLPTKDLGTDLVELERLGYEAFKKTGPYFKGLLEGRRMVSSEHHKCTGQDRRIVERGVKDISKKPKDAKDRRSGPATLWR